MAKHVPIGPIEYAALWVPSPPPSAPPPPPGNLRDIAVTFTIAGTVSEFDSAAFERALRAFSPSGTVTAFSLTVSAASVLAGTLVTYGDAIDAEAMKGKLQSTSLADLSTALGVTITGMSSISLQAPPIVKAVTLLPLEQNPVFHAVLIIIIFNVISMIWMRRLRILYPQGLLGPKAAREPKFAQGSTDAADGAAPALQASRPLALLGPTDQMPALPQLYARFDLEGDIGTFGEAQFIRRLATLIGVGDTQISAMLSAGSNGSSIVVDTEISCPDATTLVMAAKTLKKTPGPLGLALGVKLLESPHLTVPEEEPVAKRAPPASTLGPSSAVVAESVAPTIQERIPGIGGRGATQRRLVSGQAGAAGKPFMPPTARVSQPPTGAMDWQFNQGRIGGIPAEEVPRAGGAPPPAPLEGGIQERISFAGMNRSTRRHAELRSRTPKLDASPAVGGASPGAGVLESLKLSIGELTETTPAAFVREGVQTVREGIQERLPAMPGMQRRRATGEPRLRAPQGSVAQALRSFPPAGGDEAPSSEARLPIQERLPRMAPAAASPPPSPPEKVLPSPAKKSSALVPKVGNSKALAKFDNRLQTYPKVMPKDKRKAEEMPETWDDRSVREIVWGNAREHTFIGCAAVFLLGEGRKLPTAFQTVQLFWLTLLSLLFLSCAQLRYNWLGPEWAAQGAATLGVSADRPALLAAIGIASSLVGWPAILVARWIFLLVNRTKEETTLAQRRVILGSAWSIVFLTFGAFAIGACNMASNVDQAVARNDMMNGWGLSVVMQWFLIEPVALLLYVNLNLLLKWCTSFEDLPEVKEQAVRKAKEDNLKEALRKKAELKAQPGLAKQPEASKPEKPVPRATTGTGSGAATPKEPVIKKAQ